MPSMTYCEWPTHPPPADVPLTLLPLEDNPYKPGTQWQIRGVRATPVNPEIYHDMMDRNFRRSGDVFYQPIGAGSADCRQLRVPTGAFELNKGQKRCLARNGDISVRFNLHATATDETHDLYVRYLHERHDGLMENGREAFEHFLHISPVKTGQFEYRNADGKLLCVSVCDLSSRSISSVYCFFDPAEPKRSLGTLSAITEIRVAASRGIPFYYLGYWVPGSRTMAYKTNFRPCELLCLDGEWRTLEIVETQDER